MKTVFGGQWRSRLGASLLVCGALHFAAPAAMAASAFRVECPAGSYVVGFEGRAGAWVDQITPACAAWAPSEGRLGAPEFQADKIIGESNGGQPLSRLCPSGWAVGGNYTPYYARSPLVLHSIEFTCLPTTGDAAETVPRSFGSTSEGELVHAHPALATLNACPAGTLATGIQGWSGLFVDSLTLICGAAVLERSNPIGKVRPDSPEQQLLSTEPNGQMIERSQPELRSLGKVRPKPLGKVRPDAPSAPDPVICQRARAARGKFNAATQAALDTQCRNAGGNPG